MNRRFPVHAAAGLIAIGILSLIAAPAGVRAQALDPDGSLVDDFRIKRIGCVTAVRNAPSPGATSCMAIAEHIASEVLL